MPLYEYQCKQCGQRVEIIQRVSDSPFTHCLKCGGGMRKLLSAPAIQFKGSGFYKTDYASKSAGSGEPKSEASKESKENKPETKTDSKSNE